MSDFDFETTSREDAETTLSSSRGRTSEYEPVAQAWEEDVGDGEALVLREMDDNDVTNLRNLFYRRYGKENVIVKSANTEDGRTIVIREREEGEYLRDSEDESETETEE